MISLNPESMVRMYNELSGQVSGGPAFWVMPLGALRQLVGERFLLEDLREDIRNLVLDPDFADTEVAVMTRDDVGVIVFIEEPEEEAEDADDDRG